MTGPRYSRVNMDAVAPLMPSDKTAAVVGGKGVHYEFQPADATKVHSQVPLPTRIANGRDRGRPNFVDLTGAQIGRLKVVGISAEIKENDQNKIRWVVRCVCGTYEMRRSGYIKRCIEENNTGEDEPMCSWCANTRKLQLGFGKKGEEQKWRSVLGEDFPA